MPPKNSKTPESPPELRRYTDRTINAAFSEFLGIDAADKRLLKRHHNALLDGSARFTETFYQYLLAYPATADILKRYQRRGGEIASLVQTQSQHLWSLLSASTDDASARRLAQIGDLHYRFGIEPVWVMGAYLLYWDHLHALIQQSADISEDDRPLLEDAVTKFLFRDMGLMLEGYWDAAVQAVKEERNKVTKLQAQVSNLLSNLPQVLWSVDVVRNQPLYISPTTRQICEIDIEMPIPCLGWTLPEDRDTVQLAWRKALAGERVEVESRVQAPGGETRWFRRVFHPFRDDSGRVVRIDGLMEDATDAKLTIERLHLMATTDSLTGLHNRALFRDRLEQSIASARRSGGKQVVLMMMDLDHFKEINDTLGHPVGDAILRMVAARLKQTLRDSDTLARLGGDEFAVLLPDARGAGRTAEKVAAKILNCFEAPFMHGEQELYVGVGIGIAVFPDHGEDVDTLMSRADVAMYGAKHKDVAYSLYDAATDPHTPQRLQLSSELRRALDNGEFVLHYQPKIDLRSGRVHGIEALIRWRHPQSGLIVPDQFIAVAERGGFINPVTDWVMATALAQCKTWRGLGHDVRLAVNVAGRTFQDPKLVSRVRGLLAEVGVGPECLELEITENAVMGDIDHASLVLEELSDLGVTIAVDDYGTGHSSLAYLKKLPLHTLKIDKSFVMDMASDDNDAVIVRSTIDLAHNLGYQVVAEGVEDKDAWDLLCILGCDFAQGYYLSRPVDADTLTVWLTAPPLPSGCMPLPRQ